MGSYHYKSSNVTLIVATLVLGFLISINSIRTSFNLISTPTSSTTTTLTTTSSSNQHHQQQQKGWLPAEQQITIKKNQHDVSDNNNERQGRRRRRRQQQQHTAAANYTRATNLIIQCNRIYQNPQQRFFNM